MLVLPTLSGATYSSGETMDVAASSSVWAQLPIEVIFLILEAAACDCQPTALALMLVSRSVRSLITPMLYRHVRVCESKTKLFDARLRQTAELAEHRRLGWHMRTLSIMPDSPADRLGSPLHFKMPNLKAMVDMRSCSMQADHHGVLELHITDHLQLQSYNPASDQRRFVHIIDLGNKASQPTHPAPPHLEHLVVSLVAGRTEGVRCALDSYLAGATALKKLDFIYTQKHHWRTQMHLWDLATSPKLRANSEAARYINIRMILMPDEDLSICSSIDDSLDQVEVASYARLLASLVAEPGRPQLGREHTPSAFWDYVETLTVTQEKEIQLPV